MENSGSQIRTFLLSVLLLLTLCLLPVSCKYRALHYNGFIYAYDESEQASYNDAVAWCHGLAGDLPDFEDPKDISVIVNKLIGRNVGNETMQAFVGQVGDQIEKIRVEDCSGDCCGNVLAVDDDSNTIVELNICNGDKKRKICRFKPGEPLNNLLNNMGDEGSGNGIVTLATSSSTLIFLPLLLCFVF